MKLFVDTSAWCAVADLADKHHKRAIDFLQQIEHNGDGLLTTDYVFDEILTLLRSKISHAVAVEFGEKLLSSRVCEIFEINKSIRQKAWDIFIRYSDKRFSFTDCTSFAAMAELSLRSAFTFDAHFKQYGFSVLPHQS